MQHYLRTDSMNVANNRVDLATVSGTFGSRARAQAPSPERQLATASSATSELLNHYDSLVMVVSDLVPVLPQVHTLYPAYAQHISFMDSAHLLPGLSPPQQH
jgi:hypothetical protein